MHWLALGGRVIVIGLLVVGVEHVAKGRPVELLYVRDHKFVPPEIRPNRGRGHARAARRG